MTAVEGSIFGWLATLGPDSSADEQLDAFLSWVEDQAFELYPAQEEALLAIFADHHVLLTTPTGSGKSLVALGAHSMALARGQRSCYTAPIKSLVSEKFFQMRDAFGADSVGMLTGDAAINADAPVICCTAEILGYEALARGEHSDFAVVTMDEFHFYSERDRGWAWQVPLLEMRSTQFLLMSATLGDVGWLVEDLRGRTGREVVEVGGGLRPVPLEFAYRMTPLIESVTDLIDADRAPIYVVHFTQKAATEQAQAFTSLDVTSPADKARIKELVAGFGFDTPFGADLRRLLSFGVGVHHAGLLPRYRLLVERLARDGLLRLICGTDTLGVGVNVPIRTVLLTQLFKYDGSRTRVLSVREFQQIAGRAGRRGFDSSGTVWAQAPAHVIENAKAEARAVANSTKRRKVVKKKPPERGYAHFDESTFDRLVNGRAERLVSRMTINHAMVLHLMERPGDAEAALAELIDESHEDAEAKLRLHERASAIVESLITAGVLVRLAEPDPDGRQLAINGDLQTDFALFRPLSPFVLEVLDAMDPADPAYALDVLSLIEATLEDPMPILLAQQDKARDAAYQQMRADGIEFEARQDALAEIRWPRPLEAELKAMFATFAEHHPWVAGDWIKPKSVARSIYEEGATFRSFVTYFGVRRVEGLLLRYLTDAYKALQQNVPEAARTDELVEIGAWIAGVVRSVDSSILHEWERLESVANGEMLEPVVSAGPVDVTTDGLAFRAMVRSEAFRFVQLFARGRLDDLAAFPCGDDVDDSVAAWEERLEAFRDEFGSVLTDAHARGPGFFAYDRSSGRVDQLLVAADDEVDDDRPGERGSAVWRASFRVDVDASREVGAAVLRLVSLGALGA